jgi:hypothetical protein
MEAAVTDLPTRRDALVATALIAAASGAAEAATAATGHEHDWDWFIGEWKVRHRYLKARLGGATEWLEFDGTTSFRTLMGGLANVDDNILNKPDGTYRAATVRAFDARDGLWRIWWLDGRSPTTLDPPVAGGFKDGVGHFFGEDTLGGKPIKVRFIWSNISARTARWEQSFSSDAGQTWEPNWVMDFSRA